MELKIAHTEASLGWGGQEIRIFEEMKAMRLRGHTMLLIAQDNSEIYKRALNVGFECYAFTSKRWLYPFSIIKLSYYFKCKHIDVVHTHSSRDGYIAGIAAKLAGIRCLVRARHIEVDYPNKLVSRWAFGVLPDHVMTTSHKISQRLIEELSLEEDCVTCVPTGIDLEKYAPIASRDRNALKAKLLNGKASEDIILIGIVAVLRSWKGHEYFLKAAKIIIEKYKLPNVHFLIVGDGSIRDWVLNWIENLGIKDSVTMLGHREEIPDILRILDVLVLSSWAHEGIPQIILQAHASGKAVIGTNVGGIPEVVQHDETGLLVEPRNEEQLAEAMRKLITDDVRRKNLGEQSLAKAKKHYSLDLLCEKTEQIYRQLLDR